MVNKIKSGWLEYYWDETVNGETRKVGFTIGLPGTSYALVSSIYEETSSLDELNLPRNKLCFSV